MNRTSELYMGISYLVGLHDVIEIYPAALNLTPLIEPFTLLRPFRWQVSGVAVRCTVPSRCRGI